MSSDERTPLLQQQPAEALVSNKKNAYKKTMHVYGPTLGCLFILAFVINWYRTILPTPLADAQAKSLDDFSGIHAYNDYLSHFIAPHSANTRENAIMRDFLGSVASGLQQEAIERGLEMDVITHDNSQDIIPQDWFSPDEFWAIDSRNVIVRLHGTAGRKEALLINAHYDSVPTSNGVTDNGMGVATTLELLRYFIRNPPRHTIIFLFNNFEEGGLIGAKSFVNHPWYSDIKLFINLEGAGAGGRAIMFRCSNLNAVKNLANSNAAFKHGSPLGNDMFKAQIIKSDTDYSVFTKNGIPGLDIAFYAPRSHYHTPRDDLAHTTPEALQYMGQMALGAAREIANNDDLIDTSSENQVMIYYDILGRFMFVYSMVTYQLINILTLASIPAVGLFFIFFNKNNSQQKSAATVLKEKALLTGVGLVAVFSAFLTSVLTVGIASYLMCKINPSMTYGDVYGAALYCFVAAFLGVQLSQLILPNKLKSSLADTDAAWYGLVAFWWLFTALATYTGSKGIAGLFFVIYLLVCTTLAAVVHVKLPSTMKFRSPIIFFTQTLLPYIILMEISFLSMDSMRHATADGTPEMVVYILISFPLILVALHFVPWVYVAGNNRKVTFVTVIAFVFLFTICSSLQPFNGSWSPNKLIFRQEYNAGEALATVSLVTATGINSVLKSALSPQELDTVTCSPYKKILTKCDFKTDLLPKYGSNSTLNEFVLSQVEKVCSQNTCTSTAIYSAKNSLMCRVYFDPATNNNQTVRHAWINGKEIVDKNISALIAYTDKYETNVKFAIEYPKEEKEHRAAISCFYDEWTQLEVPAFTTLRDNLPENALLLIRGQGLALVNYKNITL